MTSTFVIPFKTNITDICHSNNQNYFTLAFIDGKMQTFSLDENLKPKLLFRKKIYSDSCRAVIYTNDDEGSFLMHNYLYVNLL